MISTILLLVACDREQVSHQEQNSASAQPLSIITPGGLFEGAIRLPLVDMLTENRREGIDFEFEITSFGDDWEDVILRMNTMLMAGKGYDVIVYFDHPLYAYVNRGFLVDFYDLIDNDPRFSRDDFFTNVLEAFEIDGGLYIFPLQFGFTHVGINSRLPESIRDRFTQLFSITYRELFQIYNDLRREYPGQFDYLGFSYRCCLIKNTAIMFEMGYFIDRGNRQSFLDAPRFAEFLEELVKVECRNRLIHPLEIPYSQVGAWSWFDAENADVSVFTFHSGTTPWWSIYAHLDLDEPYFLNYIPIVDNEGRLQIAPSWPHHGIGMGLSITAGADIDLAWDFVARMITRATNAPQHQINDSGRINFLMPSLRTIIYRPNSQAHLESGFSVFTGLWGNWTVSQSVLGLPRAERQQQIDNAVARVQQLNEMPVTRPSFFPRSLWQGIEDDIITPLSLGIIDSQEAAQQIHNRVALWLIE